MTEPFKPDPPRGFTLHKFTVQADGTFDPPIPVGNFASLLAWCPHTGKWIKPRYFQSYTDAWYASRDNYKESWIPKGDHFILIAECDLTEKLGAHTFCPSGPLTWETYLGQGSSLEGVRERRKMLGEQYGRTCIAKLEFTDE